MANRITEEGLGNDFSREVFDFPGTSRFQVVRLLGRGGHGAVYEVMDRGNEVRTALKLLRRDNPAALSRFKQEFRALADVTHPNLISLHELFSEKDLWFFTMELVDGGSFLDHVWERPSAPASVAPAAERPRVARTQTWAPGDAPVVRMEPEVSRPFRLRRERLRSALVQLSQGVQALHEAGKLHCDIKPSNVLVDGQGRLVLVDFGLVTDIAHEARGPGGWAGGTPGYMPPEQAQGRVLTRASDWYGVGALLHEALTGSPPVEGAGEALVAVGGDPELEMLAALCGDLLREVPEERPSGQEVLRRLAHEGTRAVSGWGSDVGAGRDAERLVGRGPHLMRLHAALAALEAGRSSLLRVVGPSGVGKSALVRSFLAEARRDVPGLLVLTGRCYEREAVPYNALDSLMDGLCRHLMALPAEEAAELVGPDVGGLARLFPVLRQLGPSVDRASRALHIPDTRELRLRAFGALRALLGRLAARQPTLLFIEDVQWGDADSAWMLAEVLRPPTPPPLLLLASHRGDVVASPFLQVFLREWARFGAGQAADALNVGELSLSESEALALSLLGLESADAVGLARDIAVEAGGNPFFLQELVRHALAVGPGVGRARVSLEEMLQQRVSRLSPAARHLVETVAVAGRPIPEAVAVAASGVEGGARAALSDLRAARLVNVRSGTGEALVEPYHDRIRETLVVGLPSGERSARHLRLAETLERRGARDLPALVEHFRAGGDSQRAGHYVMPAVEQAEKALAFELAARLYRLALELRPERVDPLGLRVGLAEALANAGRSGEAGVEFLASAREMGASSPGSERVLELEHRAAAHFMRAGRSEEGLGVVRHVLRSVGLHHARTTGMAVMSLLANRARLALRGMRFTPRTEAELPVAQRRRLDACWAAVVGHSLVDPLRSGDYQTLGTLLALEAGEPRRLVRMLSSEASYLASVGKAARRAQSGKLVETAFELSRGLDPETRAHAHTGAAVRAFFSGHWREALEQGDVAARIFREECVGATWELVLNAGVAHYALAYLGRFSELAHRSPALLREVDAKGDLFGCTTLRVGLHNQVWLALDSPEEAERRAVEGMAQWSGETYTQQHSMHFIGLQELDLYRERAVEAWRRMLEHWSRMRRALFFTRQFVRVEVGYLRVRCALAALAHGEGGWSRGKLLKDAVSTVEGLAKEDFSCAPAYVAAGRAGLAVAAGRSEEAVRLFEEAATRFSEAHMECHSAAARYHRAVLQRDDTERALAEQQLRQLGVVKPERMARSLVPGPQA